MEEIKVVGFWKDHPIKIVEGDLLKILKHSKRNIVLDFKWLGAEDDYEIEKEVDDMI
jgi:hypothetical protein